MNCRPKLSTSVAVLGCASLTAGARRQHWGLGRASITDRIPSSHNVRVPIIAMDQEKYNQLAGQDYTHIPVFRHIQADLDTPLSVYMKLAGGINSYLLESVQGGDQWGRYSIIGMPANKLYQIKDKQLKVSENGQVVSEQTLDDPMAWVESLQASFKVPRIDGLPLFSGGLVGYFGYEIIGYIEPKLADCPNQDILNTPDILLMLSEELAVFDNLLGKLYLIVHAETADALGWHKANSRLDQMVHDLRNASSPYPVAAGAAAIAEEDFVSGFTREGYMDAVQRIREYIVAGDAMQVVLSQRMSVPFEARPLDVYRALRSMNPSPYMYFMEFEDFQVVGASPEILVRKEGPEITLRPIAGTRPRGKTPTEDKALENELLADPKEVAEHVMLIDLGRNDVGRVAKTGQVELTDRMIVERYSHVMHIVSQVKGQVGDDISCIDVLRATFPAGTLSGAPKIRAMEIIRELEPIQRNVYSGAVGYLGWWNDMDMAIAIRTAVIKDGQLHVQVGAGIVHDSVPEKEWEETMSKGRALFRAVSLACSGV